MRDFGCGEGVSERATGGLGLAAVDDLVSITMDESCVRIDFAGPFDAVGTCVVVDAINAAVDAGSIVALGCSGSPPPHPAVGSTDHHTGAVPVAARSAGVVTIRSEASTWMIDLSGRRFVRTDGHVEPRFLSASAWTSFTGLWVTANSIRARTADDRYVSARRSNPQVPATSGRARTVPNQLVAS